MRELASAIFLILLICLCFPEDVRDAVKTIRSGFNEPTVTIEYDDEKPAH